MDVNTSVQIPLDLQLDPKLFNGLVRLRAGYECEECGSKQHLTAHHKDGDKSNNCLANGRCLCRPCHNDVHNGKRDPYLLDLGCGDRPYEDGRGWVHLDERPLQHVDINAKIEDIEIHVRPDSVDEIRATHVLEHFPWHDTVDVLRSWHGRLKPGIGSVYIEVPNLSWQARELAVLENQDVEAGRDLEIVNLIFGDQDYPGNFHKTGFTQRTLGDSLRGAGFVDVNVRDIGMVLVATGRRPD